MTPKARGWLTPSAIPDGHLYRVVSIPNNPEFVQAVNGAIYELALSYNWQQSGTLTPDECQEQMQTMFNAYLESSYMPNAFHKGYISGLQVDVTAQSGGNEITIRAGECRDATNENNLTLLSDVIISMPTAIRVASHWYKVIFADTPRIEVSSYIPVVNERHIGWIKSRNDSSWILRQKTVGSGNTRTVFYQDAAYNNTSNVLFLYGANPASGFTTLDLSAYVPPDCTMIDAWFEGVANSVQVALRYRAYGQGSSFTPAIFTFAANAATDARAVIPIVSQKFDLFAGAAAGWLKAGVHSYTHEV